MKPRHILSLLAFVLVFSGCNRRESAAEEGIRTRTLIVGNGAEPANLDPHMARSVVDSCVLMALYEGLTALDEPTGQAVPAVAERWEVSADGLVYTFHLRPTARWSNGDPVTASDFAFAFQRILQPKLGAFYSYMLWPIKNAEAFNKGSLSNFNEVGVTVVDAVTLRLTLERPTAYLPVMAAHMTWLPLHRATLEKYHAVDDRMAPWARVGTLVGNGPFTLAEWRADVRVVVKKNLLYWDAANTRLESVIFLPNESSEVEERDFRTGQVHVTSSLPPTKITQYREHNAGVLRLDSLSSSWFVRFNVTKKPFDNPKVRRALSLAVDRRAIVDRVYSGSRQAATCLTPPALAGYTARAEVVTDFAEARRLLAEAGFPGGQGMPDIELLVLTTAEFRIMAEIIQEQWRRELGLHVTIAAMELKTFSENLERLDYAVSIYGWIADFADPATFLEVFLSDGGNNWSGWKNSEYDRLIGEAARTIDPKQRYEIFQQAEALLLKDGPVSPLYFDAHTYLIHPAVKGWAPALLYMRRYQRVWLEK